MNRRMEDRIRKLSEELVAERDLTKVRELSVQLRAALHDHIETLRLKVTDYPAVDERRDGGITERVDAKEQPTIVPNCETATS